MEPKKIEMKDEHKTKEQLLFELLEIEKQFEASETKRKQAEAALEKSERLYRGAIEAAGAVPYYRNYAANTYEFVGDGIEALKESQAELSTIFNNAPIVMMLVDREGRVRKVNRAVMDFTGRPTEEMIGLRGGEALRCLHSLVDPRGCGFGTFCETCTMRRAVLDTFETGNNHHQVEVKLPFARGEKQEESTFLVSTVPISVSGSQMVLVCLENITERKRAEEALRESEKRFRASVENMLDCFGIYSAIRDKSGRIVDFRVEYVNGAACANNRMTREEQIGKRLLELLPAHRETGLFDEYCQVVETGKPLTKESLIYKDVYKEQRLAKAFDIRAVKLGDGFAAAWRDITERKRADEALQASHRFLGIANRHTEMNPLLKEFVAEVKNFTGCAAVGIRILDEEGNIPYQAHEGFSQKFYKSESPLSIKSDQCMCINVIKGVADTKLPFYTEGGSFYMNGTTRFLATVSEEEKGQTRNVCNQFGYESVGLVPIRLGDRLLGLIHMADPRENMVSLEIVEVIEGAAMQLGATIQRVLAEKVLQNALEESRQRQLEISALLESSRAVLEYRAFEDAARAIFNSCKNLIGATAGYVALLAEDGTENEVLFLDSGGLSCTVDPTLTMPIRALREEAYRTGRAVYHNDFSKSEWVKYMPEGHVSLDNVLFAPLVIEGKAVGLLGIANKPGGFTENDARMASAFGELTAVALLNSRTLESLGNNEERFRSVVETANDAIISIDSSGNIVFWNHAAETMFGYSADEVVGKLITIIMPERFREAHKNGMNQVVSTGKSNVIGRTVEVVGLRKDGSEFPLELSLALWKIREGTFFTGIIRDITERKQAEEEIGRQNKELEARNAIAAALNESLELDEVLNKVLDEVMEVIDTDGVSIGLADGEAKSLRVAAHRGLPPGTVELLNNLRFVEGIAEKVVQSGEPYIIKDALEEARLTEEENKLSGRFRSATVIPLKSKNKVLGIMGLGRKEPDGFSPDSLPLLTSIGNQIGVAIENAILYENLEKRVKERTAELEQSNKELKETQRQLIRASKLAAVGKLAAGVAHEINNPLGAISGYLELLEEQEVIDETARGYFARMEKRVYDIARIVKGLKDFSSQSVKSDLNLKPTDVHQVLQEALELTEGQMAHSNIEVIKEWSKDQPLITADAGKLQQVFLNIILNAQDAMPDGGFLTIKTESVNDGKYIQLLFVDTGTGIPKECIDRIFNPFFTTKPTGQGTGLGLAISYGIVKEHSGDIDVESEEGRGSVFRIILPT